MAVFGTSDAAVLMPRNIADGMITASRTTSVVARLSNREPQRFGETDYITFNDFPKAEFVEEGADKASTSGGFGSVTAKPHKAQVTMRFNQEVQWADEDYQLGVFRELSGAGQVALSRALDLGLIHRINPLTGAVISGWTNYLTAATKIIEANSSDADVNFKTAVGKLVTASPKWPVNGAAFDPLFSWDLASLYAKDGSGSTSQPRYPQLGFGTNVTDFMGVNVAQGDTVSGTPEADDTGIRAIVGDWQNGIRWGVQRELPVEIIRFGDPDGQGDLKRKNQIALRLEIVFGWYVFADRFAIIKGDTVDNAFTVEVTGAPTGGTYTLSVNGTETAAIAYNANAAAVEAALDALPAIDDVTVTGTTTKTVTFGERVTMTLGTNSLTGGTTPSVTVAHA